MTKRRTIELYDVQFDFAVDNTRFSAFIGGTGSGKTFAGCAKALRFCQDECLGMIVAPTYRMLTDATLRTFSEIAGESTVEFSKTEMRAVVGRAEVLFRSADNPERLRGPNLSWAYIDEAALCDPITWKILLARLRQHGRAGACWITTTPRGRNWVWKEFVETPRGDYRVFRAATEDNPFLDREFVEALKASYSGAFARQELYGEFVTFEGLVYEEFDRLLHIRPVPDLEFVRTVAGVDWGYTNPAVILIVGVDNDDRAYVLHEFYERRRLIGDIVSEAEKLQREYNVESWWCDPSEPANIAEMRRAGLNAQAADNAVLEGIQKVKARLAVAGDGRPRLILSPSCVNTAAEFESYCWRQRRSGEYTDEPEKVNDHAMDALRYAIRGLERKSWILL